MSSPERLSRLLASLLPADEHGLRPAGGGLPALPVAAPSDEGALREVLRLAREERAALLPIGLGSKLTWSHVPERVELALSCANLRGVLTYDPGDGTLTARSGTPMSELVRVTEAQHHLSPEVAAPERCTLGGTLAAGASGLDRLRHGPVRHQVLGLEAMLSDGTRVKSGGRVVKNVTGYDLHRLWCGSHGTLAVLLQATLRLYPQPEEHHLLTRLCTSRAEALERARALVREPLQPVAVVAHDLHPDGAWRLVLVLAGRREVLDFELQRAHAVLGPVEELTRDAARAGRGALRDLELEGDGWAPLWIGVRPSRLPRALERLEERARARGLAVRLLCHPLVAWCAVRLKRIAGDQRAPAADECRALQGELADPDWQLRWRGAGVPASAGAPARGLELMRQLKRALDPADLLAPGRLEHGF